MNSNDLTSLKQLEDLLIDPQTLVGHLNDPLVRIVDVGPYDGYLKAHIPGSVNLAQYYIKNPNDDRYVMQPDQFSDLMVDLGIANNSHVVIYDHNFSLYSARLWWVLDYYGHTRMSILNGGWLAWLKSGGHVASGTGGYSKGKSFIARADPDKICLMDQVSDAIGKSEIALWDVRTYEEYTGDNSIPLRPSQRRANKKFGHVPGAIHTEWKDVMDPDTQRFKTLDEISRILSLVGVTPDKKVITY
jgi:thiosulfate/3-mercaptopyruvate sulfurtransferase